MMADPDTSDTLEFLSFAEVGCEWNTNGILAAKRPRAATKENRAIGNETKMAHPFVRTDLTKGFCVCRQGQKPGVPERGHRADPVRLYAPINRCSTDHPPAGHSQTFRDGRKCGRPSIFARFRSTCPRRGHRRRWPAAGRAVRWRYHGRLRWTHSGGFFHSRASAATPCGMACRDGV